MGSLGVSIGVSFPNLNAYKPVTKGPDCSSQSLPGPAATGRRIPSLTGGISRRRRVARPASRIMASTTETEKQGIKVVTHPSESHLTELGVRSWPKWGCPPSKFPWTYSSKETCYLLKGKVKVYPEDSEEAVEIGAGDLVVFPKGMSCTWDVSEAVDKHYQFE